MQKHYEKPTLVEYGRIGQLTLGASGSQPDYILQLTGLQLINNNCTAGAPATSCLLPSGSS